MRPLVLLAALPLLVSCDAIDKAASLTQRIAGLTRAASQTAASARDIKDVLQAGTHEGLEGTAVGHIVEIVEMREALADVGRSASVVPLSPALRERLLLLAETPRLSSGTSKK